MAIRYTPEYNREIRRVVRNFNEKRKRAIKRGFSYVPQKVYVKDLKKRYESRELLNNELDLLQEFNLRRDAALEVEETLGGGKMTSWEMFYLNANKDAAKRFYQQEIKEAQRDASSMSVIKAEYINNLRTKLNYLDIDVNMMNQPELNTFRKTIEEYLNVSKRDLDSYRGFMSEAEAIMKHMGFSRQRINQFFEGFSELSPRQFVKMYRENTIISRIYELYIPSKDGSMRLSTTEEDAENLFNTFMEEKGQLIEKYKKL